MNNITLKLSAMLLLCCTIISLASCGGKEQPVKDDYITDNEEDVVSEIPEQKNYDFSNLKTPENQEDVFANVEILANEIMHDILEIRTNDAEKIFIVSYQGPYMGGSEQTQETVDAAFDVVKAYINTVGYEDYRLCIFGWDHMPYKEDPVPEVPEEPFSPPEGIEYNCIGKTPAEFWVYEVKSSIIDQELDASNAIRTLTNKLPEGEDFIIRVIDSNGVFLGDGSSRSEYAPFEFKRHDHSIYDPFMYYAMKFIEAEGLYYNGFQYDYSISQAEGYEYRFEFHLDECEIENHAKYESAMKKVQEYMNMVIGDNYNVIITAFRCTDDEICVQTSEEPEGHYGAILR